MASFTAVSTGNNTNASDINQLINALNGTTACQVTLLASSATTTPFFVFLPGAPGSDTVILKGSTNADAASRIGLYIRSDGYGGLVAGAGSSITARLYAGSVGWNSNDTWNFGGTVNINNGGTISGNNIMQGVSTSKLTVASSAPGSPATNDVWINTSISL